MKTPVLFIWCLCNLSQAALSSAAAAALEKKTVNILNLPVIVPQLVDLNIVQLGSRNLTTKLLSGKMIGLNPQQMSACAKPNLPDYSNSGVPQQHRFSPYQDNQGTVAAIGGQGFAVIASDTRLCAGYSILTRNQSKLFDLTDTTVLGSTGCWCDILTFTRLVEARSKMYLLEHDRPMKPAAFSQMIATMLYGKRFFPYYVSNILAGLDENGHGVVYSYDPVGHKEKKTYASCGSSVALVQPLLDNQVGKKNISPASPDINKKVTLDEAVDMLHDIFVSAAERDIHTGDGITFKIITKDGIEERTVALRKD